MSSYADLLKDRRWQQKRLEVLDSAGWECQCCGSAENSVQLHVHHKRYVRGRKPWEYPTEELEALCEQCHDRATDLNRRLDEAVASIKLMGSYEVGRATGYLEALSQYPNGRVNVTTCEHAEGVAGVVLASKMGENFIIERTKGNVFDMWEAELELHPEMAKKIAEVSK